MEEDKGWSYISRLRLTLQPQPCAALGCTIEANCRFGCFFYNLDFFCGIKYDRLLTNYRKL